MTTETSLTDFEGVPESTASKDLSRAERVLSAISERVGLRLIFDVEHNLFRDDGPGDQYLFRDEYERWYILKPSASTADSGYSKWVYLPDGKPTELVQRGVQQRRTVSGYRFVRYADVPKPSETTVTAKYAGIGLPKTQYKCTSCGQAYDTKQEQSIHCWESHPWVPNPKQVRRRVDEGI